MEVGVSNPSPSKSKIYPFFCKFGLPCGSPWFIHMAVTDWSPNNIVSTQSVCLITCHVITHHLSTCHLTRHVIIFFFTIGKLSVQCMWHPIELPNGIIPATVAYLIKTSELNNFSIRCPFFERFAPLESSRRDLRDGIIFIWFWDNKIFDIFLDSCSKWSSKIPKNINKSQQNMFVLICLIYGFWIMKSKHE